ncbi:putative efflux pump periplasmic linker protein SepA [Saliniradius amylolyticus]|uniref:Putative efflux pump periplasmic linker protein SepA n=1 Tax=Saliniradius amylolyticus TaxID=2183582 RepID=A0A2S2E0K0_9ALTE|nr:efflux RND transporter periplasmic adaptor subunit [Saliniradius amylolyticus]AWL11171.1 putative efflux pump periplasmic linker protein SepA [Saliniradius amylolyticus]
MPILRGLACALLTTLSFTGLAQDRGQRPPTQVVVSEIHFERQQKRVDVVGTAEALQSVTLYPAVAERVVTVNFEPGQTVAKEDILLALDARVEQAALKRARIVLSDAERRVKRLSDSRERGAIPQSELDDAITQRDLAQVAVEAARVALEDRRVRAPFDGVVGLTEVEVGDRIGPDTAITSIDQRNNLYVNFEAPESAFGLLNQKPRLTMTPWHAPEQQMSARLVQLDSRINSDTRTVSARALLNNADDAFRPGMSFRVNLSIEGERYIVVPEAALLWDATGAYIWLADDGEAHRVDVNIKQRLRGRVLVDADVQADDLLITEGVQNVRAGQAIAYRQPTANDSRKGNY